MKVKHEIVLKDIEGQSNLESFILKIYDVIQSIPDLSSATINIEAVESYGEPCVRSFIKYTTDETPEEFQKREQMAKFNADLARESRRSHYAALKKEFGDE